MRLIYAKDIVNPWILEMKNEVAGLGEYAPKLAILRAGDNPDNLSYERGAVKRMTSIGIRTEVHALSENIPEKEFLEELHKLNKDPDVDGILVLRPLPEQISDASVVAAINPEKDLDGISPVSMGRLYQGDPDCFAPCTAEGVVKMLEASGISIEGKHAVIIGRSLVIGKPLAQLLLQKNATVTTLHSKSQNAPEIARNADILVAALGRAEKINSEYVKEGACVIDVGIHVNPETGKLCGDVDAASLVQQDAAAALTPVPGGVGGMTTAVLADHLLRAWKKKKGETGGKTK